MKFYVQNGTEKNDFDLIIRQVVACCKLRCIGRKHSNNVARQVMTLGKTTFLSCNKNIPLHDVDLLSPATRSSVQKFDNDRLPKIVIFKFKMY